MLQHFENCLWNCEFNRRVRRVLWKILSYRLRRLFFWTFWNDPIL